MKRLFVVFLILLAAASICNGREIVVNSIADSGAGTLRSALQMALSGDTITFDPTVFLPSAPAVIYPQSNLPSIGWPQSSITIDASNAGVIIDGSDVPGELANGLQIYTDDCVVMGLQIMNFASCGIIVGSGSKNVIGGDRSIGTGPIGQGNLVANNGFGINLCSGGTSNVLKGNIVGTDRDLKATWGNTMFGIYVEDGTCNTVIGPGNIIALTETAGIVIDGSRAIQNTITENMYLQGESIPISLLNGANEQIDAPLIRSSDQVAGNVGGTSCAGCVVEVYSLANNDSRILEGTAVADESGVFAFSKGSSLHGKIFMATATDPQGNTSEYSLREAFEIVVRSTADGGLETLRWALQTARSGDSITFDPLIFPPQNPATIHLRSELPPIDRFAQGNCITIDASNAGVVIDGMNIPGDSSNGLQIQADDCVLMGLQVANFTNSGIAVFNGSRTVIGGGQDIGAGPTGRGNVLVGNCFGIELGNGAADTTIAGNIVGTDTGFNATLGSRWYGIYIYGDATGTTIGPSNVIAYNQSDIGLMGSRVKNTTITQNVYLRNAITRVELLGGANAGLAAPCILLVNPQAGQVSGSACGGCTIEIYSFLDDGLSVFEGTTVTDDSGCFTFNKGRPLSGETAIAIATDPSGNTSSLSNVFPLPSVAYLQEANASVPSCLMTYPSSELADNRIALFTCGLLHPDYEPEAFPEFGVLDAQHILNLDVKRVRLSINNLDPPKIDWGVSEFIIEPHHDAFISELVSNGISLTFNLTFWDKDHVAKGGTVSFPRFQSEEETERYLEYVQFIVSHFKGKVDYYELWNEPTHRDTIMGIKVDDYIDVAKRAVPIIRQADPSARIIISDTYPVFPEDRAYLFALLESELMPLVDVVAWHPMYGTSPAFDFHADYYYEYPSLVREIKQTAEAHGFTGEFEGDELNWLTPDAPNTTQPWPNEYSEPQCAKYFARGLLIHLGLGNSTSVILSHARPTIYGTIQNICTATAGNMSIDMPVEIDIETDGPVAYCAFRYPNGDRMLAVWTDWIAQDEDIGVSATITFPGLTAETVTGIDVLHGFEQELVFEVDGEDTIVRDLLVKDYPILIRLSDATFGPDYEETIGDGFHRIGEPGASTASDRDGDGVPDDADFCPDWPGDPAANGC